MGILLWGNSMVPVQHGQGFQKEPHEARALRTVRIFDGKTIAVYVAAHLDRANDHVVLETGGGLTGEADRVTCQLSPSDAQQLAAALMAATKELEGLPHVGAR